jgi:prepilin-type N-terminal cleavage/methylation domain-containing protein
MLKTCKRTQSAGFSLLELLLVVAVGAILILAGLGAYRLVSEGTNTNRSVQQLNTLKQQTQQAFAGQGAYGTTAGADLVATLTTLRSLPSDMPSSGTGTLRNSFGQNTTITVGASPFNTFVITFNGVPPSSCVTLGQVFTPTNASDFGGLTVTVTAGATTNTTAVTTYTTAGLTAACSGTTNNMAWTFR